MLLQLQRLYNVKYDGKTILNDIWLILRRYYRNIFVESEEIFGTYVG
jgi:hypothetical protein